MATVRELVTVWGFDIDEGPLKKLESNLSNLKKQAKAVGIQIGLTGAALFGIAKATANAGDEAAAMSEMLDLGVEAYQELAYGAKLANVPVETFNMSIRQLVNNAGDMMKGTGEAKDAFRALGVTVRDDNGNMKDTQTLLMEVADGLGRVTNKTQRLKIAQDIFGGRAAKMLLFLKDGRKGVRAYMEEARDLGFVLSQEEAEAADKFNDNLDNTLQLMASIRNMAGNELIPIITDLFLEFRKWVKANREMIKVNVVGTVRGLVWGFQMLYRILKPVLAVFLGIINALGGAERATKLFIGAWAAWNGIQILTSLVGIGKQVFLAAKAFGLLGKAALVAQAKIFFLITFFILLIDDIVAFSQGRDSVIGRMWDSIKSIFSDVGELVKVLYKIWEDLSPLGWAIKGYRAMTGAKAPFGPPEVRRPVPPSIQQPAPIPANVVNSMKPQINVTVNGGATNEQTGAVVAESVSASMGKLIKDAARDNQPIIER